MAETITMPKLGFDMAEGTLVRWVKQEGEQINKGEVLAEIETDKATVEVESSASGTVLKHMVDQGTVVPVNAPIAVVGAQGEKVEGVQAPKKEEPGKPQKPGAKAAETPGGAVQAPAAASKNQEAAQTTMSQAPEQVEPAPSTGAVKASPLARKLARDKNIDLSRVQGSGPGGRIVRKDLETVMAGGARMPQGVTPPLPAIAPVSMQDRTIQLSRLRQAIARRMTESTTSVPHFYVTHEYKMDALLEMRRQVNEYLPEEEKISVNDFILKAVALTLREFPNLNASFAGDQVLQHGAVNVGVAVSVEGGLLTAVTQNTDQLPLRLLSAEVKRMVSAAREGKVRPADIEGSTFSVSNMGMYDVENFAAIINPPEAGILAVGSARQVPVVEAGQVKPGWRMKATLSVDHRVSDGAEAARFMQALAKYIEEPLRLLV